MTPLIRHETARLRKSAVILKGAAIVALACLGAYVFGYHQSPEYAADPTWGAKPDVVVFARSGQALALVQPNGVCTPYPGHAVPGRRYIAVWAPSAGWVPCSPIRPTHAVEAIKW
ncbi:MAG: hypothetical protein ACYCY2_02345 [Acidithiobacillus ferriphilus]